MRNQEEKSKYDRVYRQKNREKILVRQHRYYQQNRDRILAYQREYQRMNRRRGSAKVAAWRHIPLDNHCSLCSATEGLERHHPDYNNPLEVITLCRSCHKTIHLGVLGGVSLA